MADLRVYFVVSTGTLPVPTEGQWDALIGQGRTMPLAAAIIQAARAAQNYISASKRSQGAGNIRKYTLCGFEVEDGQVAAILVVLNAQAVLRSVTGTNRQKFEGVLTGELRDSATALGYSGAQAAQLAVTLLNNSGFDRMAAISAVQAYLAANPSIWGTAV